MDEVLSFVVLSFLSIHGAFNNRKTKVMQDHGDEPGRAPNY